MIVSEIHSTKILQESTIDPQTQIGFRDQVFNDIHSKFSIYNSKTIVLKCSELFKPACHTHFTGRTEELNVHCGQSLY